MSNTTPTTTTEEEIPGLDILQKFLANGRTMRDFTALTPESMEVIYMLAFNLYNAAKFDEAEKIFKLLANLDHFDHRYWKGLGAARQGLKKYEDALMAYGYVGLMNPKDPTNPFEAGKCFLALGKTAEALAALRAAVFTSNNQPEYAELNATAKNLLEITEANMKTAQTEARK